MGGRNIGRMHNVEKKALNFILEKYSRAAHVRERGNVTSTTMPVVRSDSLIATSNSCLSISASLPITDRMLSNGNNIISIKIAKANQLIDVLFFIHYQSFHSLRYA